MIFHEKEELLALYDEARDVSDITVDAYEGYAVRKGDRWGVVDFWSDQFDVVIPIRYDAIIAWSSLPFSQAIVRLNGKQGIVDSEGKELLPCAYDEIEHEGWAVYNRWHVRTGDEWTWVQQGGEDWDGTDRSASVEPNITCD